MELRLTSNEVIPVEAGESVLSALKRSGVYLVASCGSKGTCGKCKVKILEGKHRVASYGKLSEQDRASNIVLACQTFPEEDLFVEVLKESRLVVGDKIAIARTKELAAYLKSFGVEPDPIVRRIFLELPPPSIDDSISDLERIKRHLAPMGLGNMRFSYEFVSMMEKTLRDADWKVDLTYIRTQGTNNTEALFLTSPKECARRHGIAVDIGTTTVVVYLVNLFTGEIVDLGSTYNSQMRHGDDVITRIIYATEKQGLQELRRAVNADINTIIESLIERQGIEHCEIDSAVIAGNTTMAHIFWGLDPSSIRVEPYIPTLNYFPLWQGSTARLAINPQAPVYTLPCVASYVGGDIVSGVLATKMHRNPEVALFMDIGTNGELAIGNNEWLMTAACSAGPCFEGSGIRSGMRATPGAIEAVRIDPVTHEPQITVIGGGTPLGICGSGMIDAISEMYLTRTIDQRGKFIEGITDRIIKGDEGLEYVLYRDDRHGRDITLTEVDIENVLRAKAAIYAGIMTMLSEIGFTLDAVDTIYVAGGFGNYINVERAITLGMLPDIPKERYKFMGNTSVTGAYLTLLSEDLRREADEIAQKMTYLELSVSRNFMDQFLSALFLPHTDMSQFPTVAELMNIEHE